MWTYKQSTGQLFQNGQLEAIGYSGHGEGRNNPSAQTIPFVGPIPCGVWEISGPPRDTPTHGPYVLTLTSMAGVDTFGRSGFLIHGDSIPAPGTASEGCIVLPRPIRESIWLSGDRALEVIA